MTRVGDDTGSPETRLEHELREARTQVETLRQALVSRAVIDQAKGILMALYRSDSDAAFDLLSEVSQQENVKVAALAEGLVELVAHHHVDDPALERILRRRLLAPATVDRRRRSSDVGPHQAPQDRRATAVDGGGRGAPQ